VANQGIFKKTAQWFGVGITLLLRIPTICTLLLLSPLLIWVMGDLEMQVVLFVDDLGTLPKTVRMHMPTNDVSTVERKATLPLSAT